MGKVMIKWCTLVVLVAIVACSGKKEVVEDTSMNEWPMMDDFHMIMAESFHPFKDSANIGPAIDNAEGMAALAEEWSASQLPKKVNNETVKADLMALKTATAEFVVIVQSGDEAAIGSALTSLHDLFHKLQEAWYGGHNHQH